MSKIKYYYDTETCRYERVEVKKSEIIYNIGGFVLLSGIFAVGFAAVYANVFPSDNELKLRTENQELRTNYELVSKHVDESDKVLKSLQERDDNVYRAIFAADPLPKEVRNAGAGGTEKYNELLKKGLKNEELVVGTLKKIDALRRRMYVQTKSYDDLLTLAKNKEQMLAHIPAIQPISNKDLTRISSGFGMRMHPVYKTGQMHSGIDFTGPYGAPIYATADGIIKRATDKGDGYGTAVEIDHGYEYVTLYAHLSGANVRDGQKVKRGECIGYLGSTGFSTGPHLHYEVLHKGEQVDPVHYFFNDLTPEQYEKIKQLAAVENQSME